MRVLDLRHVVARRRLLSPDVADQEKTAARRRRHCRLVSPRIALYRDP